MDITSNIAAASITLSSAKLQMNVNTSITKKAMDSQETAAQQLLEMLPATSDLGRNLDVKA